MDQKNGLQLSSQSGPVPDNSQASSQQFPTGSLQQEKDKMSLWLDYARWSPTAANNQSWRVSAEDLGDRVVVEIKVPTMDQLKPDLVDPSRGGSIIGLGTFAESLVHVARATGFDLRSSVGMAQEKLIESSILLDFVRVSKHALPSRTEFIKTRRTHREHLEQTPLKESHRQIPLQMASEAQIDIKEFAQDRMRLAETLFITDKIRCQNAALFSALLDEIRFSKSSHLDDGIPTDTLGATPFGLFFLKSANRFRWLQLGFRLGFHRQFIKEAMLQPIQNCAALYCLTSRQTGLNGWFELGRLVQKIWLEFAAHGIGVHPIGAPLLVYGATRGLADGYLSQKQVQNLHYFKDVFSSQYQIDLAKPGLILRVGYMKQVAPPSPRRPLGYQHKPGLAQSFDQIYLSQAKLDGTRADSVGRATRSQSERST